MIVDAKLVLRTENKPNSKFSLPDKPVPHDRISLSTQANEEKKNGKKFIERDFLEHRAAIIKISLCFNISM